MEETQAQTAEPTTETRAEQPAVESSTSAVVPKAEKADKAGKLAAAKADKAAKHAAKQAAKQAVLPVISGGGGKKTTDNDIIGITASKADNFSGWYQEVVLKAELIEYYSEISGFFIMRPPAMYVWSVIRKWFQERIEVMGVEETSFPMFLSQKSLEKEKNHVDGFAPELAWVTKAGDKDLEIPVAVRPTSEAVMYPYYARWIRSHRDLPLRLNQWNSVVRWEAKQTTPFLRAREFLWQEGHTAHLTEAMASQEVLEILELYAGVYEQLLAVPVVRGRKTEAEKFAGGYYTTTVEGYIPSNGRGIQGATSHCLGQNFSKMFDITVEDPTPGAQRHVHVWQNSWGLSTRVIGVMVMIHGDDKGLVLPPRIAKVQAILIPVGITAKTPADVRAQHAATLDAILATLRRAGVRAEADVRDGYTPPWKFNDWELKGVPLRLEFGPKDAAQAVVSFARRDTGAKGTVPMADLATAVPTLLDTIQAALYAKADAAFRAHRLTLTQWADVVPALDARNVVLIPSCLSIACEDRIKELTKSPGGELGPDGRPVPTMGMKSLCIPFDQPGEGAGLVKGETKCLNPECGKLAESWCMYGRSY